MAQWVAAKKKGNDMVIVKRKSTRRPLVDSVLLGPDEELKIEYEEIGCFHWAGCSLELKGGVPCVARVRNRNREVVANRVKVHPLLLNRLALTINYFKRPQQAWSTTRSTVRLTRRKAGRVVAENVFKDSSACLDLPKDAIPIMEL